MDDRQYTFDDIVRAWQSGREFEAGRLAELADDWSMAGPPRPRLTREQRKALRVAEMERMAVEIIADVAARAAKARAQLQQRPKGTTP